MTWIKICGITNLEDALMAVDAGADALGFVFYEKSPRKAEPAVVRQIVDSIPDQVEKVGVFVNESADRVDEIVEQTHLTAVQIYGDRSLANVLKKLAVQEPEGSHLGVIAVIPAEDFKRDSHFTLDSGLAALLIDSGTAAVPGGTGRQFDWNETKPVIEMLASHFSIIVAGGLTPTNVRQPLKILSPWGVDVSSGVEASPGKKDPEKVRAFVAAVRAAEKKTQ
jgi:phosphoribosylanthranilate isomerase